MNAFIYIEGGASGPHSKSLTIRCQMAFHKLLSGTGFEGKMPRLKPCGGRDAVYKDFCTAQKADQAGYVAMWIDSEEPMADIEKTGNIWLKYRPLEYGKSRTVQWTIRCYS